MDRRTAYRMPRPELAVAVMEKRMMRSRHLACGRCQEEIGPGAIWCPHCGFDLAAGGGIEARKRRTRSWSSVFEGAGRRLTIGSLVSAWVLLLCLLVSVANGKDGLIIGVCAFIVAVWVIGGDLSVRALLYMSPTVAAMLVFLSLANPHPS